MVWTIFFHIGSAILIRNVIYCNERLTRLIFKGEFWLKKLHHHLYLSGDKCCDAMRRDTTEYALWDCDTCYEIRLMVNLLSYDEAYKVIMGLYTRPGLFLFFTDNEMSMLYTLRFRKEYYIKTMEHHLATCALARRLVDKFGKAEMCKYPGRCYAEIYYAKTRPCAMCVESVRRSQFILMCGRACGGTPITKAPSPYPWSW